MKNINIFWKVNIILLLVIAIIMTLIILFPINRTMNFIDANEKAKSELLCRSLSLDNLDAILTNSYELVRENRRTLMKMKDVNIQYIMLLDDNGFVLDYGYKGSSEEENKKIYGTERVRFTDTLSRDALLVDELTKFYYVEQKSGVQIMEVVVPLIVNKRKYGVVRVGFNLNYFWSFMNKTVVMIIVILIASLILGIAGSTVLSLNITRRINRLADYSKSVVLGNIYKRFDHGGNDEIGYLGKLVSMFVTDFSSIIDETKFKIETILASGEKIDDVSKRATRFMNTLDASIKKTTVLVDEQLRSVSDTSGVIDEVITSVENVKTMYDNQHDTLMKDADSITEVTDDMMKTLEVVNKTYSISQELSGLAVEGNKSVGNSISAINEIDESSKAISEISLVISGIAEQTNLLAMNAAIEAAHAGEHGKGFSVVADEIRKLAEDTSDSTKNIIELIDDITEKISRGVELSSVVEVSLNKIIEEIKVSSKYILDVKKAMERQADQAKHIHSTTMSLVSKSDDVKNILIELMKKEQQILDTLRNLEKSSNDVKDVSEEQTSKTKDAIDNIKQLDDVVVENNKVLEVLVNVLQRFIQDDGDLEGAITEYKKKKS